MEYEINIPESEEDEKFYPCVAMYHAGKNEQVKFHSE